MKPINAHLEQEFRHQFKWLPIYVLLTLLPVAATIGALGLEHYLQPLDTKYEKEIYGVYGFSSINNFSLAFLFLVPNSILRFERNNSIFALQKTMPGSDWIVPFSRLWAGLTMIFVAMCTPCLVHFVLAQLNGGHAHSPGLYASLWMHHFTFGAFYFALGLVIGMIRSAGVATLAFLAVVWAPLPFMFWHGLVPSAQWTLTSQTDVEVRMLQSGVAVVLALIASGLFAVQYRRFEGI